MSAFFQDGLYDELIVDNFAGGGGASTGIEQATGRPVDIAINHDPVAVAMHLANHPFTKHLCESVWDINPVAECAGRPVGLAWFSPDCKHFSKAKGGKPVEKKIRGLSWVAIRWAVTVKPRIIMLENVEEFITWGPVIDDGNGRHYPCPKRKGKTFGSFIKALHSHGYKVEYRQLRACDYGAPTIRKRLFLIARCDGQPIVWPEPTHGDPKSEAVKNGKLKPWRTAAECIDWSIPAPSIFERSKPLAEATQRRIAKGIMRYVVNNPEPFIVRTDMHKSNAGCTYDINDPLRTVTSTGGHALVTPIITEHANASSPRSFKVEEPLRTQCAQVKGGHFALVAPTLMVNTSGHPGGETSDPLHTITTGGHHALVSAFLARHMGQSIGSDVKEPARTFLQGVKDSLITSHIVKLKGQNIGQDGQEPLHTITAGGLHFGEVRAFLLKYYGTDQDPELKAPLHTVTTKDRFGLVTVRGEEYQIVYIGMRMLTPRELFRAQGFPDSYIIDRDIHGKPVTKTDQVAKCGNSVCPQMSEALVKANYKPAQMGTAVYPAKGRFRETKVSRRPHA